MVQISLTDTLSDFFAAEDDYHGVASYPKVLIGYNPISDVALIPWLPPNNKYLIQQWRPVGPLDWSPITKLILVPQRAAWVAGKMPVAFLKSGNQVIEKSVFDNLEKDIADCSRILVDTCKFQPRFCSSMDELSENVHGSLVIPYLPFDGITNLPHYFDPDEHYDLQSKRALALSGLPTPAATLIDFEPHPAGWTGERLRNEIARAIEIIHKRSRPFVLKSNSSYGSKGVYLVHTQEDQAAMEVDICNCLTADLPRLDSQNAQLHPFSLVLTDFLPGDAVCVNFWVRCDGTAQFSSCCGQDFSTTGHWLGGAITYSQQQQLALTYSGIIGKTSQFLRSRGYHGPVGIDVMTDEAGMHQVVDLNPRLTGTWVLGCLRPHYSEHLLMDEACVLPFMNFKASRECFNSAFQEDLEIGKLIVLAWCSDPTTSHCFTSLAAGGRNKVDRDSLIRRVNRWVEEMQPEDRQI
ncbi:solid-state culture specific protein [Apiospora saccharicola]